MTGCGIRMELRAGVYAASTEDGSVSLINDGRWGERIGVLSEGERTVLRLLSAGPRDPAELSAAAGPGSDLVARLESGGWLTVHYGLDGAPLVTVRPLGPHRRPRPAAAPATPRLSRFAVLHSAGGAMVLESPLCRAVIEVHDAEVLALLHQLGADGAATKVRLPDAAIDELTIVLAWYGFLDTSGEPELTTEQWSAHELWFHSRSRAGYHDEPFGATGWAAGRFEPPPVRRPPWPGDPVALPVPDRSLGVELGTALATRRSLRGAAADPLTLAQLGEFLHWSARVQSSTGELSTRPSPSGGALHSLEIYPVVSAVAGLAPGMYHYDPFAHRLSPVPATDFATGQLINRATAAANGSRPQVLFVIAARFGRVMSKYQSMGYALILKDLGALVQTMYLVATALSLAPCALGAGDIDLFAQATGLDRLAESSVGEFVLSTRA